MSHEPQSQCLRPLAIGVTCTILLVLSTLLLFAYFQAAPFSIRTFAIALSGRIYHRRPSVWLPNQTCTGTFSSLPSEFSDADFPNALLREAYLDLRPASQRHARKKHGPLPTQRIMIAVTLHLSVQIQNDKVTASLRNAPDITAHVDDVREIESHSKGSGFMYSPGKTTKRGHEVYECQLIITLRSKHHRLDFADYIRSLVDDPRVGVLLNIPLERFDGHKLTFTPSFALGCVFGWDAPNAITSNAPKRIEDPSAILFCANSLSGNKKERESYHSEVAHWAARSLRGTVRFDVAILPIIADRSISECNMTDNMCLEYGHKQNERLFNRVAENVVAELNTIGVPDDVYERIVLIPFCRLGTHATGYERGDACSGSQRYGQHHITFMPYTLLGGYYKWSMIYDLDEYIAMTDGSTATRSTAVRAGWLFDDILLNSEHMDKAAFTIAWLNFRIRPSDVSKITSELLHGESQKLVSKKNESSNCYELERRKTGKAVVRYDVGLGFLVHQPVVQMSGKGMRHNKWQVSCRSKSVRVWHARLFRNRMSAIDCAYVPSFKR